MVSALGSLTTSKKLLLYCSWVKAELKIVDKDSLLKMVDGSEQVEVCSEGARNNSITTV